MDKIEVLRQNAHGAICTLQTSAHNDCGRDQELGNITPFDAFTLGDALSNAAWCFTTGEYAETQAHLEFAAQQVARHYPAGIRLSLDIVEAQQALKCFLLVAA